MLFLLPSWHFNIVKTHVHTIFQRTEHKQKHVKWQLLLYLLANFLISLTLHFHPVVLTHMLQFDCGIFYFYFFWQRSCVLLLVPALRFPFTPQALLPSGSRPCSEAPLRSDVTHIAAPTDQIVQYARSTDTPNPISSFHLLINLCESLG